MSDTSDRPIFTEPLPGTVIDYDSGTVTFRWSQNGGPQVKKWWLSVGTEDGHWNIRNHDKQNETQETISVSELPPSGKKVWAQVYGKVQGREENGNPLGPDEYETINSDPVWWDCP